MKIPCLDKPQLVLVYVNVVRLPGIDPSRIEPRKWGKAANDFLETYGLEVVQDFLPDVEVLDPHPNRGAITRIGDTIPPVVYSYPPRLPPNYHAFVARKKNGEAFNPDHDPILLQLRSSPLILVAGPYFAQEEDDLAPLTYSGELYFKFSAEVDLERAEKWMEEHGYVIESKTNMSGNWYFNSAVPPGMGAGMNTLRETLEALPEIEEVSPMIFFPTSY